MLYLNYARRDGEWTPNRDGGNINLGAVAFLQKLNTTVLTAWPGCVTVAEESSAYPGVTKPPYDAVSASASSGIWASCTIRSTIWSLTPTSANTITTS